MNKLAIFTAIGIFVGLGLTSTAHGQLLGPSEYLCFDTATTAATGDCANKDSPFKDESFSYFHLENFEDQLVDAPGVTFTADCGSPAPASGCPFISVFGFIPEATDSVDEDDGAIDGSGATTAGGGQAIWARGNPGIEFSFDAAVLGALPTHAGIVWTDGSGTWTFEAFDGVGASMGTITAGLGDGTFLGTTADDRFFGAINLAGISRIKIMNPGGGGIEVDHLQYGSAASETGPSCRVEPRNTYLPTHVFETHILNPARHPPHDAKIVVLFDGSPAPAGVDISLFATRPVFFDGSGMPTLPTVTLQTDDAGEAAFEYVPPSAQPFDRTDFEASGSFDGMSFNCQGSVVAGMGSLTTLLQTVTQGSLAPQRALWDKVLAQLSPGRDLSSLSSDEIVEILLADPQLLRSLHESLTKYPPLLQATAIARALRLRDDALNKVAAVLEHLESYTDSRLRERVRQVRGYLAEREVLAGFVTGQGENKSAPGASGRAQLRDGHDQLPPLFEANRGQAEEPVRYLARGPGYHLYLTPQEAVLVTGPVSRRGPGSTAVLRVGFVEAHPNPKVVGLDQHSAKSHYLIGDDPAHWHVNVPHYAKVKYEEIYPGVDLVYYGNQSELEYDFIVAPGASPDPIALTFKGVQEPKLNKQGDLILATARDQFQLKKPFIYQEIDGFRQRVAGRYRLGDGNRVGFYVGDYDSSQPLVIDPVLSYSSYVGGGDYDASGSIAVGPDGSAYVTGSTASLNFPPQDPLQPTLGGGDPVSADAFVAKLNPEGSGLVYSTYIGGSGMDAGLGIAVDEQGNAYVAGSTRSADLPIVGAVQTPLVGARGVQAPSSVKPDPSIKDMIRRRAGDHARNLWQWNYFYEGITGARAPDPFQLVPSKLGGGQWTIEDIKTYRLGLMSGGTRLPGPLVPVWATLSRSWEYRALS